MPWVLGGSWCCNARHFVQPQQDLYETKPFADALSTDIINELAATLLKFTPPAAMRDKSVLLVVDR